MNFLNTFLRRNPWITRVMGVWLVWRLVLFLTGFLAPFFLKYQPSFPYSEVIFVPYHLPQWLYSWANFDGVHYLTIVEKGYLAVNFIQAFFPVYPLLISALNLLHASTLLNGLALSSGMALVAMLLWFAFLKHQYSIRHTWIGLAILCVFPSSFFLGAFYNEALFLALVLGTFVLAQKKYWLWAGVLAGIAAGTRIVGIFLVPALAVEWWLQYREVHHTLPRLSGSLLKQNWQVIAALLLGCTGLLGYMYYLQQHFGDPLYFFHVQSEFGAGRQESLVWYPQVVWRSLKILLTARPFDLKYFAYVQEFLAGTLGLLALIWAVVKKVRWSYVVFALAAFLLPTLTGTFSSMSRYLLVCFPIFMVLTESLHKRPKLMIGYLILSSLILLVNVVLFIQGYWVA